MDPIISRRIDRTQSTVGKAPGPRGSPGRERRIAPPGSSAWTGSDVATGATATAYTRTGRTLLRREGTEWIQQGTPLFPKRSDRNARTIRHEENSSLGRLAHAAPGLTGGGTRVGR
jgi:hypothetical protein